MTTVLLDTNILLNFYRFSPQSIIMIDELLKLIKSKKIILLIPHQIIYEFYRDKSVVSNIFNEEIKKSHKIEFKIPPFLKSYKGVKELKKYLKKIKQLSNKIIEEHNSRISKPRSQINQKINKLIRAAITPKEKDLILQKAHYRTLRGNPPRKRNNSFGDAIIWETIIDEIRDNNLVIISKDGDFASETNENEINDFLKYEWQEKNKGTIKLFTSLGEFINTFSNKKVIKKDILEEEVSNASSTLFLGSDDIPITLSDTNLSLKQYSTLANHCSICNKEYTPKLSTCFDRCEDCQGILSSSFTITSICSKCGKSYERYPNIITLENKCPECQ